MMDAYNGDSGAHTPRILFVDDERLMHDVLERLLSRHGIQMVGCSDATLALELLEKESFDLVLTDFVMPGMDGLDLARHIQEHFSHLRVVMVTANGNVQHAVQAMKAGVVDYIPKPFSTDELIERLLKQLDPDEAQAPLTHAGLNGKTNGAAKSAQRKPRPASDSDDASEPHTRYIGEHESIENLKMLLPRVAQSQAPVFIHGESGTGKEILSRCVHEMSERADGPYVAINCANLPRELVESHLFGHRKGAFTGAIENVTGAFERAHGGTLLLDEVTEIDLQVQAKLLRVIQEQEFQKVGTTETQRIDVRIVATSNRDLRVAVQENQFREDLYHRLAVFPLHVPPLRDRLSDVPLLVEHFVEKFCVLYTVPTKSVSANLMKRLTSYSWPGNVRELENLIHRGVVLATDRDMIKFDDVMNDFFSGTSSSTGSPPPLDTNTCGEPMTIEDMEREMIMQTLAQQDYNQRATAEILGISDRTIRNKLKRYREEGYLV